MNQSMMETSNIVENEVEVEERGHLHRGKIYAINMIMLPCKIAYFSLFFAIGAFIPFLNVFLRSVGFRPTQIGLISGIRTGAQIMASPLWCAVADKTGRPKVQIRIIISLTMPVRILRVTLVKNIILGILLFKFQRLSTHYQHQTFIMHTIRL